MKKIISLLLAVVILLSLCACESQSVNNTVSTSRAPSVMPTQSAQEIDFDSIRPSKNELSDRANDIFAIHTLSPFWILASCPDSSVYSAKNFSVGSTTVDRGDEEAVVHIKGTFMGYDEYGSVVGQFNFDYEYKITYRSETDVCGELKESVTVTKK